MFIKSKRTYVGRGTKLGWRLTQILDKAPIYKTRTQHIQNRKKLKRSKQSPSRLEKSNNLKDCVGPDNQVEPKSKLGPDSEVGPENKVAPGSIVLGPPYASVHPYALITSGTHPYAPIRLHTHPLRIEMSMFNTHVCRNVKARKT